MKKIVLDASVAVKWFSNEELTDKAILVRDAFLDGKIDLYSPEHMLYEVGNSLWKNKKLTTNDCQDAMESILEMRINLIRLDTDTSSQTMKLARDLGLTFYDAAYVQVSKTLVAPLLTADRLIIKTVKNTIQLKDF